MATDSDVPKADAMEVDTENAAIVVGEKQRLRLVSFVLFLPFLWRFCEIRMQVFLSRRKEQIKERLQKKERERKRGRKKERKETNHDFSLQTASWFDRDRGLIRAREGRSHIREFPTISHYEKVSHMTFISQVESSKQASNDFYLSSGNQVTSSSDEDFRFCL
jgi:hypothetical protein